MQILMKFGNISELSKPNELIKSKFYQNILIILVLQ